MLSMWIVNWMGANVLNVLEYIYILYYDFIKYLQIMHDYYPYTASDWIPNRIKFMNSIVLTFWAGWIQSAEFWIIIKHWTPPIENISIGLIY